MTFPVGIGVLRNADGDLLVTGLSVSPLGGDIAVLGIVLQPSPLVVALGTRAVDVVRLAGAEGEELGYLLVFLRVRKQVRISH